VQGRCIIHLVNRFSDEVDCIMKMRAELCSHINGHESRTPKISSLLMSSLNSAFYCDTLDKMLNFHDLHFHETAFTTALLSPTI